MRERVVIAPEAPDDAARFAIVERARRRGFRRFLVDRPWNGLVLPNEGFGERSPDGVRLTSDARPVPVQRVGDPAQLERALAATPAGGTLVIEWTGDRVIPLEAAVAARGRRFELVSIARSAREIPAALGALEHGADCVIVPARSPEDVDTIDAAAGGAVPTGLAWSLATIEAVDPVGSGDRVIVDTTSQLSPDEGLLVGSAAAFLFHVASEAVGSAFSRPRPFRVNAGAVHSYVLLADGSTRYLSELLPGDNVLAARPDGTARAVRVGRLKLERRPLVMVRAAVEGRARTVFLQEAETVRLSGEGGRLPATALVPGAKIWGVSLPAGRHLGVAVEESVEER